MEHFLHATVDVGAQGERGMQRHRIVGALERVEQRELHCVKAAACIAVGEEKRPHMWHHTMMCAVAHRGEREEQMLHAVAAAGAGAAAASSIERYSRSLSCSRDP